MFPDKAYGLVNALMTGGADITSAEHGYKLVELAEIARSDAEARRFFTMDNISLQSWERELPENSPFKQAFRGFLKEYGHRGVYELDIINPAGGKIQFICWKLSAAPLTLQTWPQSESGRRKSQRLPGRKSIKNYLLPGAGR